MVVSRIMASVRKADFGALLLEMFVLIAGIMLALAADRIGNRLHRRHSQLSAGIRGL